MNVKITESQAIIVKENTTEKIKEAFKSVFGIQWYFEAKNLVLRNALQLRTPLTVEKKNDLRLYYSSYFSHVLSATEVLLEKKYLYREQFEKKLYELFVFEGFNDGEVNYSFVRELRNSIIHRGYDITSQCVFYEDRPLLLSPGFTTNASGLKKYPSIGISILEVIQKCEQKIGLIIAQHIEEVGLLVPPLSQEELMNEAAIFIEASIAMPEDVKRQSLALLATIDFIECQKTQLIGMMEILKRDGLVLADAYSEIL